jgi:8-oxo-dGTP diphosphatase
VPELRVVAAAVVHRCRLLLVSKRAAPDVYFLPGGKPHDGEPALACLRREIREELGVGIDTAEPFGRVWARAALEPRDLDMTVYLARLAGPPAAAAEIASIAWWPHERELQLAPAVRDSVIPRLRAARLL